MREEKKPYNPFHLASGHAARSLPDKLTIAVFKCYCNHTDFMGGSVSISVETVAAETGYSVKSVNNANKVLKALGRITRKSRGRPGSEGGKQSSITTVYCTDSELAQAGANEENFYSRGGKGFVVKTQSMLDAERAESARIAKGIAAVKAQKKMSESAKSPESKRKTGLVKTQPIAQEPLTSEPLKSKPWKAEPTQACSPAALRLPTTKSNPTSKATPTPGAQEKITPAVEKNQLKGSAPRAFGSAYERSKKCEGYDPDSEDDLHRCKGVAVPGYRFCPPCLERHLAFCASHPDTTDPDSARDLKYPKELLAGLA